MKRFIVVGLAIALVFGFSVSTLANGVLSGGEYVGYSTASDRGFVEAHVTIEDGEIANVELIEWQNTAEQKDDDYSWEEWHDAMELLPERFAEANSADVDMVSGATGTSEMAIEAVEMALAKAKGTTQFDGRYMGFSEPSDRGNIGVAWVTLEDGNIQEVRLEEVQESDGERSLKDEEYSYDEYFEAQENMPERFVEANSADVDVYSGATGSANLWMEAVADAMEKAGY
ncbi:MAG: FMN-binding protein [Bacillota bacterium]